MCHLTDAYHVLDLLACVNNVPARLWETYRSTSCRMECIETPPILHLLVSGLNFPVIHLIYVLYVLKMSELDFAASFLCFFPETM